MNHHPTEGGSYIVLENGTICTKAEAEKAKASKILPEPEQKSTDQPTKAPKSKGK